MLRQKAGWMTRAGYKAALVISLALSLFLAGSGGEIVPQRPDRVDFGDLVPFPDFDRDPRYSPMMAQYEAILRGEGRFWLGGKEIDLYQIMKSPESNITATAEEFAVVDMDGDGAVEVILRLTVNGNKGEAYVILHYYDGAVYGFTLFIRQFGTLRENGTLDHGDICDLLRFDGGETTLVRKTDVYTHSSYTKWGLPQYWYEYFVDGVSTTLEDYRAARKEYCRAKKAKWYGLSFIERHVSFPAVPGT